MCTAADVVIFLTGAAWECSRVIKEMFDFSSIQKVNTISVGCHILLRDIGSLVSKHFGLAGYEIVSVWTSENIPARQNQQEGFYQYK